MGHKFFIVKRNFVVLDFNWMLSVWLRTFFHLYKRAMVCLWLVRLLLCVTKVLMEMPRIDAPNLYHHIVEAEKVSLRHIKNCQYFLSSHIRCSIHLFLSCLLRAIKVISCTEIKPPYVFQCLHRLQNKQLVPIEQSYPKRAARQVQRLAACYQSIAVVLKTQLTTSVINGSRLRI